MHPTTAQPYFSIEDEVWLALSNSYVCLRKAQPDATDAMLHVSMAMSSVVAGRGKRLVTVSRGFHQTFWANGFAAHKTNLVLHFDYKRCHHYYTTERVYIWKILVTKITCIIGINTAANMSSEQVRVTLSWMGVALLNACTAIKGSNSNAG